MGVEWKVLETLSGRSLHCIRTSPLHEGGATSLSESKVEEVWVVRGRGASAHEGETQRVNRMVSIIIFRSRTGILWFSSRFHLGVSRVLDTPGCVRHVGGCAGGGRAAVLRNGRWQRWHEARTMHRRHRKRGRVRRCRKVRRCRAVRSVRPANKAHVWCVRISLRVDISQVGGERAW